MIPTMEMTVKRTEISMMTSTTSSPRNIKSETVTSSKVKTQEINRRRIIASTILPNSGTLPNIQFCDDSIQHEKGPSKVW